MRVIISLHLNSATTWADYMSLPGLGPQRACSKGHGRASTDWGVGSTWQPPRGAYLFPLASGRMDAVLGPLGPLGAMGPGEALVLAVQPLRPRVRVAAVIITCTSSASLELHDAPFSTHAST
ncbi:hypothetical protein GGI43DRAFT_402184 [Trichoderma evansii]